MTSNQTLIVKLEAKAKREALELAFKLQLRAAKLIDGCKCEYQFHGERKWRFDFAWPDMKLAIEVEGGTTQNGRHNRAEGYEKDCEKYNTATAMGWTLFRFTAKMIHSGNAVMFVDDFFKTKGLC